MVVEDDGHGVAPEDLARIQEPFEHAGRGEAAQHSKGAGLGLTLVKAFAELHGGWLELESVPGAGFRATILLPQAQLRLVLSGGFPTAAVSAGLPDAIILCRWLAFCRKF